MSFVEQEDVFAVIEKMMTELFEELGDGRHVTSPFPRIPFRESMLQATAPTSPTCAPSWN